MEQEPYHGEKERLPYVNSMRSHPCEQTIFVFFFFFFWGGGYVVVVAKLRQCIGSHEHSLVGYSIRTRQKKKKNNVIFRVGRLD